MKIDRRTFIKMTGATVACMCVAGMGTTGCSSKRESDTPSAPAGSCRMEEGKVLVALPEVAALQDTGGAVKFTLFDKDGSEHKFIVVHSGDQTYRAFSDRCTHKGKELIYLHGERKMACSGLGSQFDLAGRVLRGPAEDALVGYPTQHEGELLTIEA
jgi:Rieske Fe-S protein